MAEYIEREAVIETLKGKCCDYNLDNFRTSVIIKTIKNIPIADVRPEQHGQWLRVSDDDQDEGMYFCSECKKEQFFFADFALPNYCTHCGAKMDK